MICRQKHFIQYFLNCLNIIIQEILRPNGRKLSPLFTNRINMTWEESALNIRTYQLGLMGEPNEVRPPGKGEFHENPSACICEDSEAVARLLYRTQNQTRIDTGDVTDEGPAEDEQD